MLIKLNLTSDPDPKALWTSETHDLWRVRRCETACGVAHPDLQLISACSRWPFPDTFPTCRKKMHGFPHPERRSEISRKCVSVTGKKTLIL
ncbi:hypothetical protein RR46_14991 [Papilio xuthus]|uniref:Uncharacterized protein n=1 Tax=Papilio xuthus TaxID=66420 RepID=A0A194PDZ9_PAPXU|nr:hypothetical protein RR46_14991 [Papilio xuthus]